MPHLRLNPRVWRQRWVPVHLPGVDLPLCLSEIGVLILNSGVPHQSKAPSSEFTRVQFPGCPISPRLQLVSSGLMRVLIVKSWGKAPSLELKVDESPGFKFGRRRRVHSSIGPGGSLAGASTRLLDRAASCRSTRTPGTQC